MLSEISLKIFQNSELLLLILLSIGAFLLLKIIYTFFHFKKHFYLVALTIIYGIFIFHDLGEMHLPKTYFDPQINNSSITLKINQPFDEIITITGEGRNNENEGKYQIYNIDIDVCTSTSANGPWNYLTTFNDKTFFKYDRHTVEPRNEKFVKLIFKNKNSILNEIWFLNNQNVIEPEIVGANIRLDEANKIIDEQAVLNLNFDYQSETYFDEVYHVRNAYEILNHEKLYTATHPLLGTRIMAFGAQIFGPNPFGFRFFGALFTVAMIPMMYLLLKEFFKKDAWPLLGATLYALDFMPFTTGRIGTLEPFSIFFIMLMFKCYFKALKINYTINFKKHLIWMGISGFVMSIAIITKWTAVYGAVGMGIMYIIIEGKYYFEARKIDPDINEKTLNLILFSFLVFVFLPIGIYFLSFINLRIYPDTATTFKEYIEQVFQYNLYSLNYHSNLDTTHPFSSEWYQWLLDIRPIWYYVKRDGALIQTISCFNNPLITIPGLLSVIYLIYHVYKRKDLIGLLILIAYASELIPWIFITRPSFAYHYYPCLPLLIVCMVYVLSLISRKKNISQQIKIYLALSLICFVIFMPVYSGFKTTKSYVELISVLPTWKFK